MSRRKKKSRQRPWPRALGKTRLTPKEAAFLRYFCDPKSPGFGNATRVCELAGYKPKPGNNQLAVQGQRLLHRPSISQAVEAEYENQGLTPRRIVRVLVDALGAEEPKTVLDEQGKRVTKMFPNHKIRLLAVVIARKLCPTNDELPELNKEQLIARMQQLTEEERKQIVSAVENTSDKVAGTHQTEARSHLINA